VQVFGNALCKPDRSIHPNSDETSEVMQRQFSGVTPEVTRKPALLHHDCAISH